MRKYLLLTVIIGFTLFVACTEQDIKPFGDRHEVYFQKYFMDELAPGTAKADSTDVTFFFAKPTDDHVMAEVVVVLAGRTLTEDIHFGLKVVEQMTTANPDEYELEDTYLFRARPIAENLKMYQDTIYIRMNKSGRLGEMENGVRLVVELVPSDELQVGQYERSRAIIHLTEDAVRPLWWTKEVEAGLFGYYSSLKYKLFLENVEGAYELDGELIEERPDQALKLVRAFKEWLDKNPVYDEENQTWITVNV